MPVMDGAFLIDGSSGPSDLDQDVVWRPEKYEKAVQFHLREIRRRETGRIVERQLGNSRPVIVPDTSSRKRNTMAAGHVGAVSIYFSPGFYMPGAVGFNTKKARCPSPVYWIDRLPIYCSPGRKADEDLFHEIFHAMRTMTGSEFEASTDPDPSRVEVEFQHRVPTPLLKHPSQYLLHFQNSEDFYAVVIANIYLSEKNNRLSLYGRAGETYNLRRDHNTENGHVPLAAPNALLVNEPAFRLLKDLHDFQRDFCNRIALVPATFNPVRDMLIGFGDESIASQFIRKFRQTHSTYEFYRHTAMEILARFGPKKYEAFFA